MTWEPVTECPACFGDGAHDLRNEDAWFGEHFSDADLDGMRERGLIHPAGIVACSECEGTGIVTVERARDLRAAARAIVAQIAARLADEDRLRQGGGG